LENIMNARTSSSVLSAADERPTIVQLPQGSPEWLEYRRAKRNASEAAAVLGLSPWLTPYQLWLLKTGRSEVAVTAAMHHGAQLEPEARAAYEARTGHVMQPLVMQSGTYSASLDGITLGGDLVLEIKCPFRGEQSSLWQDAVRGEVPAHYRCQIQHQLMVSGATLAHLWVYAGSRGLLLEVQRDDPAIEQLRRAWDSFQACIDTDSPPPLCEADTVQRTDAAWVEAAKAYKFAKRLADEAATGLDAAREALTALAQHAREHGGGISVTRYWKSGPVNYKAVPALRGVDLTPYRGRPREEIRVLEQD
jgi:putative phage-type endonuclease